MFRRMDYQVCYNDKFDCSRSLVTKGCDLTVRMKEAMISSWMKFLQISFYLIVLISSRILTINLLHNSVALLAKSGGCSYEEKAKFASLNIQPQNNIVKYVIIYDDETRPTPMVRVRLMHWV